MNPNKRLCSYWFAIKPLQIALAIALMAVFSAAANHPIVEKIRKGRERVKPAAAATKVKIHPADSLPLGLSYADWTARWCEWAFTLPAENHPFYDETGADVSRGQSGPVWFLVGAYNDSGTVVRSATIPHRVSVLVPIINAQCFSFDIFGPPSSEADLADCAKSAIDLTADVSVEIDGKLFTDLQAFRFATSLLDITFGDSNVFGLPGGHGVAVDDGYYIMIEPLPVGDHTLRFRGTFTDVGWGQDVTYNLKVVANKK